MLTVKLICVGKLRDEHLRAVCDAYLKRLRGVVKLELVELEETRPPANPSAAQISACLTREGESVLQKLDAKGYTIAFCIEGKKLDSPDFARLFEQVELAGKSVVQLIIGGSYGLSDAVKQRADLRLSMSDMTFPHLLARAMVLEQIYRAFQIRANTKYHK